jgi:hypothetical protein
MKKVLLVLGMTTTVLVATAQNQDVEKVSVTAIANVEENKVEIKAEELPASATAQLAEKTILKAFKIVDAEGKTTGYQVTIKDGETESVLSFDVNGNLVK